MTVAHQAGIVHRDLKPANILINNEGLLKIVDFGVAAAQKEGDTQLTKTGYVIGSPKYMAPEQILGKKVDERADIYSLGVIMYEMVTGVPPVQPRRSHVGHVSARAGQGQGGDRGEPAAAEADVRTGRKAMSVDKMKRFQNMEEMRLALEKITEAPLQASWRAARCRHQGSIACARPIACSFTVERRSAPTSSPAPRHSLDMARIDAFLKLGTDQGCSDIHFAVGLPPMLRMHGDLMPIKFRDLSQAELEGYITEISTRRHQDQLRKGHDVDFSYVSANGGRFRVNVFRKETGIGATFRAIPAEVPTLDRLGAAARSSRSCATTTRA